MISYEKGAPPMCLTALSATPDMTWDGLGEADRGPIRDSLIRDQGGLCAYCQRRITSQRDQASGHSQMTIERWISRSQSTEHHLTWSNLLGVCLGTLGGVSGGSPAGVARHCDASRGNRALFLHPVQGQGPDPREHLAYTKNGKVSASAEGPRVAARVASDIELLQLNAWALERARKAVYDAAWKSLERSGFTISALRRLERSQRLVPGISAPEHAEFLSYHVRKKIRQLGHTT